MVRMKHQELLKGLIRLHILHHAAKDEFYGQWMIHEPRPPWLHAQLGDALPDAPPARAPRIFEVARRGATAATFGQTAGMPVPSIIQSKKFAW